MPTLIGTVGAFGIPSDEAGILIESIDFDGKMEKYEQKDKMGRKCGVMVIDQELSFSMSGAVPRSGAASLKMAASLTLANSIPDIWDGTAPTSTTVFLEGVKRGLKNTEVQKMDVSGTVYAFGTTVPSPPVV